jgi:hypothetical protein
MFLELLLPFKFFNRLRGMRDVVLVSWDDMFRVDTQLH